MKGWGMSTTQIPNTSSIWILSYVTLLVAEEMSSTADTQSRAAEVLEGTASGREPEAGTSRPVAGGAEA